MNQLLARYWTRVSTPSPTPPPPAQHVLWPARQQHWLRSRSPQGTVHHPSVPQEGE